LLDATAFAMAGEISPISASAIAMPMGPTMICALRQATMTGFSPVATRSAPARRITSEAALFVPTAMISRCGKDFLMFSTKVLPSFPPWPSMTRIVTVFSSSLASCFLRENP